jgi:hypothetical protein
MVIDVKVDRSKLISIQRKKLTQNKLLEAFNNISKQLTIAKFRPNFIDFFFNANATIKRKGNSDSNNAQDLDNNDLLSVVCPPLGVDAHTLPKSMFND